MIVPARESRDRWIVFEQEEDGRISYSRMILVSGIVGRKVDLMFTFLPLIVDRPAPELRVFAATDGRMWTEELSLDGGPFSADCSWRWTKPHLALGAAVLGPRAVTIR